MFLCFAVLLLIMDQNMNRTDFREFAILGDLRLKYAANSMEASIKLMPTILFKKGGQFADMFGLFFHLPAGIKKVLLHVGINDILNSFSAEHAFCNLKTLLKRIKTKFPNIEIIFSEIGPIGYDFYFGADQTEYINKINSEVYKFKNFLKDFVCECPEFKLLNYSAFHYDFLARDGLHYSRFGIFSVMRNVLDFFRTNLKSALTINDESIIVQKFLCSSLKLIIDLGTNKFLTKTQERCLNDILSNLDFERAVNKNLNDFPPLPQKKSPAILAPQRVPRDKLITDNQASTERAAIKNCVSQKQVFNQDISCAQEMLPDEETTVTNTYYELNLGAKPKKSSITSRKVELNLQDQASASNELFAKSRVPPVCPLTTLSSKNTIIPQSSPFEERENRKILSKGYYNINENGL